MAPENSQIEINLPQEGIPNPPTPRQLQFLEDYGLSDFENLSKEQVDVLIEAMEHGRVAYHYLNPGADHFPLWMRRHIIQFIISDAEIKNSIVDKKLELNPDGLANDDLEPEQNEHFQKLKLFIESELPKLEPLKLEVPKSKPKQSNLWKWLIVIVLWELMVAAFYFL